MTKPVSLLMLLLVPAIAIAQTPAAPAQRIGITAEPLQGFEDLTLPGKEFRIQRTTYAPGGSNPNLTASIIVAHELLLPQHGQ